MKKRSLVNLLFPFLFLSVSAQTDSLPAFPKDTLIAPVKTIYSDRVDVIPQDTVKTTVKSKKGLVYHLKPAVDIPVVAVGTGWSLYAFTKIYNKGPSTEAQILSLSRSNINAFDRSAVRPYSKSLDDVSYYPFYGAMPLPFIFFLTGTEMRQDFLQLSFLYWETFAVEGLFGTGATYFVDRYRPYVYSSETPMDKRIDQNSKNSFYAGHVEVVATSTFFIAKVYSDYYPDSKIKWVFYGAATAATAGMGYLRYQAGMHFPSDILLGSVMGAATGILVPHFHKHKLIKDHDMSMTPFMNGDTKGITIIYK